jgi:hypothetical protein
VSQRRDVGSPLRGIRAFITGRHRGPEVRAQLPRQRWPPPLADCSGRLEGRERRVGGHQGQDAQRRAGRTESAHGRGGGRSMARGPGELRPRTIEKYEGALASTSSPSRATANRDREHRRRRRAGCRHAQWRVRSLDDPRDTHRKPRALGQRNGATSPPLASDRVCLLADGITYAPRHGGALFDVAGRAVGSTAETEPTVTVPPHERAAWPRR